MPRSTRMRRGLACALLTGLPPVGQPPGRSRVAGGTFYVCSESMPAAGAMHLSSRRSSGEAAPVRIEGGPLEVAGCARLLLRERDGSRARQLVERIRADPEVGRRGLRVEPTSRVLRGPGRQSVEDLLGDRASELVD